MVVSTFGVMFAPNQVGAAAEMLRVCKPGGKIGLANWTPDGFIGHVFKTIATQLPPPPQAKSPMLWGTRERLNELFGPSGATIHARESHFVLRYRSPEHWLDVFKTYYGPLLKAFGALSPERQTELERDLLELVKRFNRVSDGTMVVPNEYLEIVIER